MKKKKILTSIIFVLFCMTLIFFMYNLFFALTTGKNKVDITLNKKYYAGSNINASIQVYDKEMYNVPTKNTIASKVKVTLYDSDHKKVKNIKETYNSESGETIDTELKIPEDLKPGVYNLEFKVSTKKGIDEFEKSIIISDSSTNDLIISLDKGIYKPGDEVNFRGMLLSKKDNTPISSEMNISIYDGNSNKVYSEDVKTSEYGITSGKFELASEVNSGIYKIVFIIGNQEFSKQFKVNPYVTPKFEVNITSDKEVYKVDEQATLTIDSKYFFGEPVVNANVELTINEEEIKGLTNAEGKYIYDYTFAKDGTYSVSAVVTDESNYMIESKYTLLCSNELFSVELLPEYGDIINDIDNKIYVYTTNLDGTPLKTYTTVKIGKISKQVLVDENGVGVFELTSNDLNKVASKNNKIDFEVISKNMNEESVQKEIELQINRNAGIVVGTDKVKYNQGEDITVKLNSSLDKKENILCICKDSKILKTIKTDEKEFKINLDNKSGLINIYSLGSGNRLENKKTIFIVPKKSLNINVETEEEVYKPGEELKIDIELKDENGNNVDGAVLVSILDEAILSLAENDLNIDNLMLALSGVEFADGIDLASVYATILDSKNEILLMGMLLKQSSQIPELDISSNYNSNYEYEDKANVGFIITLIMFVVYLIIKFKKVRQCAMTICIVFYLFICCILSLGYAMLEYLDFNSVELVLILNLVISIFIYKKFLSNSKEIIFKNICVFLIIPLLVGINLLLILLLDVEFNIILLFIVFGFVLLSILGVIYAKKNVELFKQDKNFWSKVFIAIVIYCFKLVGVYLNLLAIIIISIYEIIITKKSKNKEIKIVIDSKSVIVICCILIVFIYLYNVISNFATDIDIATIEKPTTMFDESDYRENNGMTYDDFSNSYYPNLDSNNIHTTDSSSASTSIRVPSLNIFDITSSVKDEGSPKEESNLIYKEEKVISEDENIRNIFLESLCFLPEVITENGKASQTIDLSDNITTWQIQTVANTKDGRVGYANGSIRVFKEFFVDFSLPTNSVVGDKISIPVTVHNYTENDLEVDLNVKTEEWFSLGEFNSKVFVKPDSIQMVYVPIEILLAGNNSLRIEGKSGEISDIIQISMETKPNGVKVSKVMTNGAFEKDIKMDVIYLEEVIEDTRDLTVKLYPTTMNTVIEGLDSIFKLPTGCFEQTSSTLYPNIVALRYMEENEIIDVNLKEKALGYISAGYQRLLTFEVKDEKGGYSLYGKSPAETLLTAYGLMQLKDLTSVYKVDENVLKNMKEFVFNKQNINGSFEMQSDSSYSTSHIVNEIDNYTLNAYITWALSEAYPEDSRLEKSIEYLENGLDEITDNYTLALVANVFANTNNKNTNKVIDRIVENIDSNEIKSNSTDYWGTRGSIQNVQATALTSIALSKTDTNTKTNKALIDTIISKRSNNGTWGSTQSTILALKALVEYSSKSKLEEQEIKITLNDNTETISVNKNSLDLYEVEFSDVNKENKLSIELEKGNIYYEVIQEYYMTYDEFSKKENDLTIESNINTEVSVNDTVVHNIKITNNSDSEIYNGMVEISIPQGFSVKEESLSKLESSKIIERYEYNYSSIYLYLRDFEMNEIAEINIEYNPNYPANITGGMVRVYDYYNPDIEVYSLPFNMNVK